MAGTTNTGGVSKTPLRWTTEWKIIVQIELWDKWDMHADHWKRNP